MDLLCSLHLVAPHFEQSACHADRDVFSVTLLRKKSTQVPEF